jgi:hypothetical protein
MHPFISMWRRVSFWWQALRLTWSWAVLILVGLWGFLAWIRDEFVPDDIQTRYQLRDLLPDWGLERWITLSLFLLLVVFIEAGYQIGKQRQKEIDRLYRSIQSGSEPKIDVVFREHDKRYLVTEGKLPHKKHIALVSLHNTIGVSIDDVNVACDGVVPVRFGNNSILLRPMVGSSHATPLDPEADRFVRVLAYNNCFPEDDYFDVLVHSPAPQADIRGEEFLMKVKVTGRNTKATRIKLRFGIRTISETDIEDKKEFYVVAEQDS